MPGGGVYYSGRPCLLFINIDYIARLRKAGAGNAPDLTEAALLCEKSGCDGIAVSLREDNRLHIQDRDVFALKDVIRGKLNLEISLSDNIIEIAKTAKPNQVNIVSDKREEASRGRGLDVTANMEKIKDAVHLLHDQGIPVSICVEPDTAQIEFSKACGADFIEIDTWKYCIASDRIEIDREIGMIYRAAEHAVKVGINVSAGHGLDYGNIIPVLKARALEQVTIGHAIVSRSIFVGLSKAVEEMLDIMD